MPSLIFWSAGAGSDIKSARYILIHKQEMHLSHISCIHIAYNFLVSSLKTGWSKNLLSQFSQDLFYNRCNCKHTTPQQHKKHDKDAKHISCLHTAEYCPIKWCKHPHNLHNKHKKCNHQLREDCRIVLVKFLEYQPAK